MKTLMKQWLRSSREGRSLRENELLKKLLVFRRKNAIKGKSLTNDGFFSKCHKKNLPLVRNLRIPTSSARA